MGIDVNIYIICYSAIRIPKNKQQQKTSRMWAQTWDQEQQSLTYCVYSTAIICNITEQSPTNENIFHFINPYTTTNVNDIQDLDK
jgi:hypothetical protein